LVLGCDKKASMGSGEASAESPDPTAVAVAPLSDVPAVPVIRDIPDWPASTMDVSVEDAPEPEAGGGGGGGVGLTSYPMNDAGITAIKVEAVVAAPEVRAKGVPEAVKTVVKAQAKAVKKHKLAVGVLEDESKEVVEILRSKKAGMSKRQYKRWKVSRAKKLKALQLLQQIEPPSLPQLAPPPKPGPEGP
jgi:hypothetical protein